MVPRLVSPFVRCGGWELRDTSFSKDAVVVVVGNKMALDRADKFAPGGGNGRFDDTVLLLLL